MTPKRGDAELIGEVLGERAEREYRARTDIMQLHWSGVQRKVREGDDG